MRSGDLHSIAGCSSQIPFNTPQQLWAVSGLSLQDWPSNVLVDQEISTDLMFSALSVKTGMSDRGQYSILNTDKNIWTNGIIISQYQQFNESKSKIFQNSLFITSSQNYPCLSYLIRSPALTGIWSISQNSFSSMHKLLKVFRLSIVSLATLVMY